MNPLLLASCLFCLSDLEFVFQYSEFKLRQCFLTKHVCLYLFCFCKLTYINGLSVDSTSRFHSDISKTLFFVNIVESYICFFFKILILLFYQVGALFSFNINRTEESFFCHYNFNTTMLDINCVGLLKCLKILPLLFLNSIL